MRERREAFRDARLIVIATEGKDTERIYFTELAKEYTNPRVHVHILYYFCPIKVNRRKKIRLGYRFHGG